jgi:ParB family chromosome partitioning protein
MMKQAQKVSSVLWDNLAMADVRLPILATEIKLAHQDCLNAIRYSAERAVDCGNFLLKAQALVPKGRWMAWVESETGLSVYLVTRYMRLAGYVSEGIATVANIAEEGQRAILGWAPNRQQQNTGDDEWFTPPEWLDRARAVMGGIDLDPASHPIAQQRIQAATFYTAETDGLAQDWRGRVWLNPPYTKVENFVWKLVTLYRLGPVSEAIILTNNFTDTGWFHDAEAAAGLLFFTKGRIRFLDHAGTTGDAPLHGQCFFYFGSNQEKFRQIFGPHGFIR